MPNGADIIAKRLFEAGCRHAFGIPGGEVLALIDALDRAGITFHLAKHENAAGFMAEGVWHMTGAPAILVATLGPGVANCVNVVANALQDRVPMIVLSGRVDAAEAETYTHQVFDHQALMRPITKGSFTASAGAVDVVIARALTLALAGQPGPVHIDLPIRVAEMEEQGLPPVKPMRAAAMKPASTAEYEEARRLLSKAKRPLVIAGVDAVNQDAGPAVRAFCRKFNAPLITSYKGKGLLREDDPLSLGGAGLSPRADQILLPLILQSDCIVLAGYDPIEMRINWRNPWPDTAPVIDISAVLPTHFMHRADFNFIGDVSACLSSLGEGIADKAGWPDLEPSLAKAAIAELYVQNGGWGPDVVFQTLRRLAPENTVITADSGAHRILLSQIWQCYAPRTMLQSSGLCTMGCAMPLALGVQMTRPDLPVIAFMGDAGCEMVLGELATIRDQNAPVILVVLVDEALALIELKQRAMQKPQVGVRFGATDFVAVAQAMGGEGVWVEDKVSLESAFSGALKCRDKFTLIAARIAKDAYQGKI